MVKVLPDLQNQAEAERIDHFKTLISSVSSVYIIPLFLIFGLADFYYYPKHFQIFLGLRVLTAIAVMSLSKLIVMQKTLRQVEIWASVWVACCIWPLHAMVFWIGDSGTPYFAGLILAVTGLAGAFRFTKKVYYFNISQMIFPFLIAGILSGHAIANNFFLLNLGFLSSIAVIMSFNRWFNERLHIRELESRMQLAQEVKNRDSVIALKTTEALKLQSLSRQFSPQIVSSLQSGKLSLDGSVHRSEICAIFVDIVGSTEKFISSDRDDLQRILAMYMEDVMGTFLKYDITIDKFLGDGVFGFSNDPIKYPDYIERVLRASIEIKDRIRQRIDIYNRYWLSDFEISIGIATGFASIGFYGSDLHVKSYTAIGRVINLAARLGSAAKPNEILCSHDVILKLKDSESKYLDEITFKDRDFVTLKGFENEKVRLFTVESLQAEGMVAVTHAEIDQCPKGHGLLYLDQNAQGIYFFRCRHCDFVLDEQTAAKLVA